MYLVDTNIWLERILDQKRSQEVGDFLARIESEKLFITDFSFHSIAISLLKHGLEQALLNFVKELFVDANANLVHLEPEDTALVLQIRKEFGLDFDDAYQYAAAEKYQLELVSFDADFNKTARGKKLPSEIA